MQGDGRKTMADAYLNLKDIETFKRKCLEKQDSLVKRARDTTSSMAEVKQKLKELKVDRQQRNKSVKDTINTEYTTKINRLLDEAYLKIESIYKSNPSSFRLCQL